MASGIWWLAKSGLWLIRRIPSALTSVIFTVPVAIQIALVFSASQALLTAWADGLLLLEGGDSTVIGLSFHAHNACYSFMSVAAQRFKSPFYSKMRLILQYALAYWPAELTCKWALRGFAAEEVQDLVGLYMEVISVIALSLLSRELQRPYVMVKILDYMVSGGQSALPVQSMLTLAASVTGSIGSALVADPGRLIKWIDTMSPSPSACCLILALDWLAPTIGVLAASTT